MLDFVVTFNCLVAVIVTVAYFYQLVYLLVGLVNRKRQDNREPSTLHRFAVVISARNEEAVIGTLLESLRKQNYPSHLLDLYVIADNCTDRTAQVSRECGATVYERFNKVKVGKGYAMDEFFRRLTADGRNDYDGYFVFDADNIVDPNFVREMNRTFDTGKYAAITSYRNSKNFSDNWISAGYSLWFLREARFLNFPRMLMGTTCAISGTGFLVSGDVIRQQGGWPYHLLTEDIEFSVNCALKGQTIGYCDKAVIYDEQPVTFSQSWDQRLRWSKGFYQVDAKYALSLVKGCGKGKRGFGCYDMLMTVAPAMFLTLFTLVLNGIIVAACLTQPTFAALQVVSTCLEFMMSAVVSFYMCLFMFGAVTTITEWKNIHATVSQKLISMFTFPLFMFTYVPISLAALVRRVEWKPIYHGKLTASAQK